jgi:hypothetical protein
MGQNSVKGKKHRITGVFTFGSRLRGNLRAGRRLGLRNGWVIPLRSIPHAAAPVHFTSPV